MNAEGKQRLKNFISLLKKTPHTHLRYLFFFKLDYSNMIHRFVLSKFLKQIKEKVKEFSNSYILVKCKQITVKQKVIVL